MGDDLKWVIGIGVTLTVFWGGLFVGAFWRIVGMIKDVRVNSSENTKELHARIDRVREDTVQKSDLDGHLNRIYSEMREGRQEQREATKATSARLDALIATLTSHKP